MFLVGKIKFNKPVSNTLSIGLLFYIVGFIISSSRTSGVTKDLEFRLRMVKAALWLIYILLISSTGYTLLVFTDL